MNTKHFSKEPNKEICFGFDCDEKAIWNIYVNAGQFGILRLSLCSSCINKFKRKDREEEIQSV